jgi:hypothetical protein
VADDIKVAPSLNPADPSVATDDVGGKHYQKIKAGWGPDGTVNETDEATGKRLPVSSTPSKTASVIPAQVAVAITATSLLASNLNRKSALIRNIGSYDIYLGQSGVLTTTGFLLRPGETFEDDRTTQQWYGIASGAASTVCVMES